MKFDSAKADTNYFRRQIGAALKDSQPVLALQFLSRATAKFPRDAALLQAYSQELRKQGLAPEFFSRSGEVKPIPEAFCEAVKLVTAGVACVNCKHSHGLVERPVREGAEAVLILSLRSE